jgi:ABC-type branched-subunit amino acid transport system ATPase component
MVHEICGSALELNEEEGVTVLLVEQELLFARRVASEIGSVATMIEETRLVFQNSDLGLSNAEEAPNTQACPDRLCRVIPRT